MSMQRNFKPRALVLAVGLCIAATATAQDHSGHVMQPAPAPPNSVATDPQPSKRAAGDADTSPTVDHAAMGHAQPVDDSQEYVDHSSMQHAQPVQADEEDGDTVDHAAMGHATWQPESIDDGPMDHSRMDHSRMDHSRMDHSGMDHSGMDHSDMDRSGAGEPEMDHAGMDHSGMDHSEMDRSGAGKPEMDPTGMDHSGMDHGGRVPTDMDHSGLDHAGMKHAGMDHAGNDAPTAPLEPIPVVTDADRAAAFPPLQGHMQHASEINSFVLFNRLEATDGDHGRGEAWEGQAWIGGDINRVWLRTEGERSGGRTESADLEVLYGRSITPWWDLVAGVRHDFKPGPSQSWAAFGVQGLAPYMFEVSATAYVGESGRTAANLEVEYELLLTNRLILQPLLEVDLYGKSDPQRGIGSGLSTLEAGLRLRYEFNRRFAPYIGVVHERAYGGTADLRRADGEAINDNRVVAGIRVWF